MPNFILRGIPASLWNAVKARAEREQRFTRHLILDLLSDYVERGTEAPRRTWPREAGKEGTDNDLS